MTIAQFRGCTIVPLLVVARLQQPERQQGDRLDREDPEQRTAEAGRGGGRGARHRGASADQPVHPGPRTTRPGRAPVCSPSRNTWVPLTNTWRTPVAY